MARYTFLEEYKKIDSSKIWDLLIVYIKLEGKFQSIARQKEYQARICKEAIVYRGFLVYEKRQDGSDDYFDKYDTIDALEKIRVLSIINPNNIRPYLREAQFPIDQCLALMGLLQSADIIRRLKS